MSNKYLLVITADTNDADYTSSSDEIDENTLNRLKPVFTAISNFKPYSWKDPESKYDYSITHNHNWPVGDFCPREDLGEKHPEEIYKDVLTEEQIDLFNDYRPYGENGIHTIESITVYEFTKKTDYL